MIYYQLAADQGHAEAQCRLGFFYERSIGDIRTAFKYYQLAADQGHLKAQYRLGFMYERSNSYQEAFKYYQLAADQSLMEAQYKLANLYEKDLGGHHTKLRRCMDVL